MDYEKKYKNALEWARQVIAGKIGFVLDEVMELFPELKESEDERIKNKVIKLIKMSSEVGGFALHKWEADEMLAWLEKQGGVSKLSEEEQNKFAKTVLTSCALSFIDYLDANKYDGKMCVSNGECEDIENAFHNAMWDRLHRYYCKYITKQGEKKPTLRERYENIAKSEWFRRTHEELSVSEDEESKWSDKVQPKFKVGDWIVNNNSGGICQVTEIRDNEYCLWPLDGEIMGYLEIVDVDNDYHLWTIKDAKDGDILAFKNNISGTIICKSPTDYDTRSYCRLVSDYLINKEESGWDSTLLVPATKEQRELLFQKMKEVGYVWNAEKKELTEIEQQ